LCREGLVGHRPVVADDGLEFARFEFNGKVL
jgi:hypothetical protein